MFRKFKIEKIAFEKGYYVNNLGEAYSYKNKKLKLKIVNGFYYCFNIRYLGVCRRIKVYRLQAYQKFKDEIYKDGIVVRHLDGNSFNNSVDNIDIGTSFDNYMGQPVEQRLKFINNAGKANRKYSKQTILQIRDFYNKCKSYKKVKAKFNISSSGTLNSLLKRNLDNY